MQCDSLIVPSNKVMFLMSVIFTFWKDKFRLIYGTFLDLFQGVFIQINQTFILCLVHFFVHQIS